MATEDVKKQNYVRMSNLTLTSLAVGVWDTLGETSYALSLTMGDELLHMLEKEMGLEIAGETPEDVIQEIARIFVDELGFASNIEVVNSGNDKIQIKVAKCIERHLTDKLIEEGVEKPFICPAMNASFAALSRMGLRMHHEVAKWEEHDGCIITMTKI